MTPERARELFADARVARLATVDGTGAPHLVPLVFAVAPDRDVVYSAVDAKPKRTTQLRRLANIAAQPRVCLLADRYDDAAWEVLWWVRADGSARVLDPADDEARAAVDLLVDRYPQYARARPDGPVVAVDVQRWRGWSAAPPDAVP
jgi:PPOX class probable F420-dependent enzyme